MINRLLIIFSFAALAGCAIYPPANSVSNAQDIRTAILSFGEAMSDGDLEKVGAMYADAPDFFWMESGKLRYQSKDEALASLDALAESGLSLDVEYTDIQITELGPKSAIVSVVFETEFSHPSGRKIQYDGVQTTGMVLTEEGWKIASGHTESVTE